jgi:hypothetical protein
MYISFYPNNLLQGWPVTRILTIIALLFATPAWADEEESRREMLEMADGFARCAAVFKVMALSSSGSGKNFSAKQDEQLANGAEVASWCRVR